MGYLAIIERLKKSRQVRQQPTSGIESPYEINEKNERSTATLSALINTAPEPDFQGRATEGVSSQLACEEPPPDGRAESGVFTVADLPDLEHRLRLSGWRVDRR